MWPRFEATWFKTCTTISLWIEEVRETNTLVFELLRSARMQLTDELIGDLHNQMTNSTSEDLQRIDELLSLPKNKELSPPPSSRWRQLSVRHVSRSNGIWQRCEEKTFSSLVFTVTYYYNVWVCLLSSNCFLLFVFCQWAVCQNWPNTQK